MSTNTSETNTSLKQSSELDDSFNNFFFYSPIALIRFATDGSVIVHNKAFHNLFGFKSETELNSFNYINNNYRNKDNTNALLGLLIKKEDVLFESIWHNPGVRSLIVQENIRVIKNKFGEVVFYEVAFLDISSLRKAERSLEITNEKFKTITDQIPVGIYRVIATGEVVFINQPLLQLLGYATEIELKGTIASETLFYPEEYKNFLNDKIRSKSTFSRYEYELTNKLGKKIWVQDTAHIFYDTSNEVLFFDGTIEEITERKNAEQELNRLITAFNQLSEGIVVTDNNGIAMYANPAFEKMTQYTSVELVGKNMRILKSGQQTKDFYKKMWQTIINGDNWEGYLINKKKNNELYNEYMVISPVKNSSGHIINFVAVKRDITKEVRFEHELRNSQKLQAIGTLAGGIAHDFNNILMGMQIYTEVLLKKVKEESSEYDLLEKIYVAQNRAKDLIKQILSFSRQSGDEREPLYVHVIVKEAIKLIKSTFPATIKLEQRINDCGCIMGNPTHIHQIVLNLLTNANHAMEGNGTLTIELRKLDYLEKADGTIEKSGRNWVRILVKDTGTGIEEKIKDRIFEPFFTTKDVGYGTGLGLATVHGIVKQYGGEIYFNTTLGKGTIFYIYLPALL
jgi:PAS domain S-box-containing protein